MNTLKVWLMMGLLSVLLVLLGDYIAPGGSGALIFLMIALVMNLIGYYRSDKIAIRMTNSRPVSEAEAPQLYDIIRHLTTRAGLPMPRVYITPSPQPNAFATGRNPSHAAVAVTEGLLRLLNRTELEGVLGHEIGHIKHHDILIGAMAATLAGAISMIGNVLQWGAIFGFGRSNDDEGGGGVLGALAMAIIAPLVAMIIQMAISRSREYQADAYGAYLAGSPHGLADALLKLERGAQAVPMQVNPAASHLFIVNPLSGASIARLFSTHPSTADRVARLRQMRLG